MKNRRYSDKDWHLWPFTLSKAHKGWYGIILDSGSQEGEEGDCHLRIYAFGFVLMCELPRLIKDFRIRHKATYWTAADIERMGRDWYEEIHPREYGFLSTGEGGISISYGPDTGDSSTTKSKYYFMPWRSRRFIRTSYYDANGEHFWTDRQSDKNSWNASWALRGALTKRYFQIEDYDGEIITAATHIEEREWRYGTKWCSWLSWFVRPHLRKELSINFSSEVGKAKGSWKGGTLGHGIEMLPGEDHADAFERYCQQEFRSKEGKFRIEYRGPAPTVEEAHA